MLPGKEYYMLKGVQMVRISHTPRGRKVRPPKRFSLRFSLYLVLYILLDGIEETLPTSTPLRASLSISCVGGLIGLYHTYPHQTLPYLPLPTRYTYTGISLSLACASA